MIHSNKHTLIRFNYFMARDRNGELRKNIKKIPGNKKKQRMQKIKQQKYEQITMYITKKYIRKRSTI